MTTEQIVVQAILAVAVIVALSHVCGLAARRCGQPAVIGQLLAGIALGPSLLGRLPGNADDLLFPRQIVPALTVVAQIALVLFLFTVGYELEFHLLRRRLRAVPLVAAAGFVAPMLLGAALTVVGAAWFRGASGPGVPHLAFVLFIAVSFAITAVPVLAGIIAERGLTSSTPGVVAMAAAGVIDALGWLTLAFVLLRAGGTGQRPLWRIAVLLLAYLLVMVFVFRPVMRRWIWRSLAAGVLRTPVVAACALASAWVTGALGLHVILGALLAGLLMPRRADSKPYPEILGATEKTGAMLLPVFFVVSGLSTDLGMLRWSDVALLVVACLVATLGKLGAGLLGALAGGLSWTESTVVGVLLNTRGLTELIALNAGYQLGIINARLYTIFVLMALITTVATGPLLTMLTRRLPAATVLAGGDQPQVSSMTTKI